jgi:electron transfer flavoprotein alpha subunit
MELNFSLEDHAFREKVSGFLREALPAHIHDTAHNGVQFTRDDLAARELSLASGYTYVLFPATAAGRNTVPWVGAKAEALRATADIRYAHNESQVVQTGRIVAEPVFTL